MKPNIFRPSSSARLGRVLFVTGTDTGAGKTLLTSLLLCHLRRDGRRTLALKPFCSGSRGDVTSLRALQDGELSVEDINPWFFPEPVAPLVSARRHRRRVPLEAVAAHIESFRNRCDLLLVEGAGGLLAPLGEGYSVLDLIGRLRGEVVVVARNRLGVLNHTLLTVRALQDAGRAAPRSRPSVPRAVVLMGRRGVDASGASNGPLLAELLAPVPVIEFPWLGAACHSAAAIRRHATAHRRRLARLLE